MLPLVPLPFLLPLLAQLEYASATTAHGKRTSTRSSRHRSLAQDIGKRAGGGQAPAGGFETVGDSGVSAQMMFVGTTQKVMILDSALLLHCPAGVYRAESVQRPRTTR
jgi:hypothetical protein